MALKVDPKILRSTPLGEGGEAIIYNYDADTVLKVFKDCVDKPEKLKKLDVLIASKFPPAICAPIDIAYNMKDEFIGYIMPRVKGTQVKFFASRKFLQANGVNIRDIAMTMAEIAQLLSIVHKAGVWVGDLNDCNILFDAQYHPHLIDVDSWSVGGIQCTVCVDSFRDPLMVSNHFSPATDAYAFAIMAFKSLTRLHPFGGTMNPDISLNERMSKGLSVIDRTDVTIPSIASNWNFLSPDLLYALKENFETNKRYLVDSQASEFASHLKQCSTHSDYYYSKYSSCPICTTNAKVVTAPQKGVTAGGIPYVQMFIDRTIRTMFSPDVYIDAQGYIVHRATGRRHKISGLIYFSDNADIMYLDFGDSLTITSFDQTMNYARNLGKANGTRIVVRDNSVYYVTDSLHLRKLTVTKMGNTMVDLCSVAFRCYFDVYDDSRYFVCNEYDTMKVLNINGTTITLQNHDRIREWGIHYDSANNRWLFVFENSAGVHLTYVFGPKGEILYTTDQMRYTCSLKNLCFANGTIFKPVTGAIRGFRPSSNAYRDFECPVVTEDSMLTFDTRNNKFTVVNDHEYYVVG